MRENMVISVSNQKGGVGKTTTVLNLGTALGLSGKKILLIDNDPQGNLTAALGYIPLNRSAHSQISSWQRLTTRRIWRSILSEWYCILNLALV